MELEDVLNGTGRGVEWNWRASEMEWNWRASEMELEWNWKASVGDLFWSVVLEVFGFRQVFRFIK